MIDRCLLCALITAGALAVPVRAEAQAIPRPTIFGVAGGGSFGDDEGSLGGGFVGGGGAGVRLNERVQVEAVVTTTRHSQEGSISWVGRPTVVTGRALYLFGSPVSRARAFAGAGVGFGHYAGKRTDTIFDSPVASQRLQRVAFDVNGLAAEIGAGMDIRLGTRGFIRPEAWLATMGGERTQGLEPAFVLPRVGVSVGLRF